MLPVATTEEFRRELPAFTEGEGVFMAEVAGFRKKEGGEYPTRRRMDHNPLNRKEYLLHVRHVC
jgi:ribosomal protection tetracycline resistance protein